MSLDVTIKFKKPRPANYFLEHPYIYDHLSDGDKANYNDTDYWSANITHNLNRMAAHVPVIFKGKPTTLYYICWRPEEIDASTTDEILPALIDGICYMLQHRFELIKFNPENGWGTYEGLMKFLLNYKQACEDNPGCTIKTDR